MVSRPLVILILLGWMGISPLLAQRTPRQLRRALDQILEQPALAHAWWGVLVVNLHTGQRIYQRNEQLAFIPASNTKLYTTAAALELLGPDFTYRTALYMDGPVEGGVLKGNLIIRGSGDPTIGGRFTDGDRTATFRAWADSLRALGITAIEGSIIGDDDAFDDQPLGYGWSWDDETYWYAAETGALSFNDNCVDVSLTGGAAGGPAHITWEPHNTDYVRVFNRTNTLPPDADIIEGYYRPRGTNTLDLYSQVPAGGVDRESLTITNPTLFFVHVLRETLLREGLPVAGRPVDVDDLPIKPDYQRGDLHRVAVHASPPLAEIVNVINKQSQNLYAEQVLKTLAAVQPLPESDLIPGSAEMGLAVAAGVLAQAGVDTSHIQLVDGSGLARQNLVTPEMTAALLSHMAQHPDAAVREAFMASLPVGGVDGSLRFRYPEGPARGNVRAKTGTVSNASTLSGYVTSAGGTPYAFVIMANHYTLPTRLIREVQDEIVQRVAQYPK